MHENKDQGIQMISEQVDTANPYHLQVLYL